MAWYENLTKSIRNSLEGDIDTLLKADGDQLPEKSQQDFDDDPKKTIGSQAIIDDPYFDQVNQHFIFKNKMSRISNRTLKDTSIRDWVTSAILQARADTMLRFARPQLKQLEMGFKIFKTDDTHITSEDKQIMANIEDFVMNCGRKENTPKGDEMQFGEFLKLLTRDALTFGNVTIEKILTRSGGLHRFRPVPAENMYLINPKTQKEIIKKELKAARTLYREQKNSFKQDNDPSKDYQINEPEVDYYKYVQMSYNNQVLAAFGDDDMIWKNFNPQNFADSMGYCFSPLELAIINVTNHLNIENYNANFFTHGYAAKGILHLKGTVTQSQLTAFRRQFYNTISGTQHAWRTPIIAGLDDVQWVQLSGNAREMEYLNYNNHIIRALCTQFQIDPIELGLDYLAQGASGRSASQQANNEYKITYSRERGLYPILMMFEDLINGNILPALDPELAKKYVFRFVGYTDDTPQTKIAQLQAEMSVHSSLNNLLKDTGKEQIKHPIADLPLNEAFWNMVEKNLTRGEIREFFLGDKGASQKRELQYIPSDPAFLAWQQLLITIDRAKKQEQAEKVQMEQQQQEMEMQQQQQDQEQEREQEAHDTQIAEDKARKAHGVVNHSSIKDIAKDVGAASRAINIGGRNIGNPINQDDLSD